MTINPLSQINAPISEELRTKMRVKLREMQLQGHNARLKAYKETFSKMEKIEDSVWLQIASVQGFRSKCVKHPPLGGDESINC